MYGDFGANADLDPEENLTVEAGVEFKLSSDFRVSGLFFNRKENNTVLWIDGGYLNAADVLHARGVELELDTTVADRLSIQMNYSFTEYKESLARRIPKHKVNFQTGYDISKATFASVSYQYTHQRFENSFVPLLDSFRIVNLYLSHSALKDKITFFAGIDNLLNEAYEDVPGYATKVRNARVGFKLIL